jgi:hypothetical protein
MQSWQEIVAAAFWQSKTIVLYIYKAPHTASILIRDGTQIETLFSMVASVLLVVFFISPL